MNASVREILAGADQKSSWAQWMATSPGSSAVEGRSFLDRALARLPEHTLHRVRRRLQRLPVLRALPAEEQRAKEILTRHTGKNWTLCDAISFAMLDARHVARAFTFDRHFRQYGRIQLLGLQR